MSGVSITVQATGFDTADKAMARLSPLDTSSMLVGIGRKMVEQTRTRIFETKQSPDGKPWKNNLTGTSILKKEGHLADTIRSVVSGDQVIVGSGRIYSAIHQFGGVIKPRNKKALKFKVGSQFATRRQVTMPARPYLGVSKDNASEIMENVADFIRRKLR